MRKIELTVIGAFVRGESACVSNTSTDGLSLWLHGNLIAIRYDACGDIYFGNAGWDSRTTQSRLNALLELTDSDKRVATRDFTQYVIDGNGTRETVKAFPQHRV
tara:strand:+ start:70 stop:381 length:312 start_codon:yes stop_codon:yes gene_type:complete